MAQLEGAPVTVEQMQALALTNYGHFTSMRVENLRVRGLDLHLERLRRDCGVLFGASLDTDHVRQLVRQVLGSRVEPAVARVTVFDPTLNLGRPGDADAPKILVSVRPAVAMPQPPMRVQSAIYQRDLPAVKHVGLLGLLHHRRQAQRAGFDDTLFIDSDAHVAEGGTWNVGFIDHDGTLVWPEADVLPGVTMALVSQAHRGRVETRPTCLGDLGALRAVFATNAAFGVRPIDTVDDVQAPCDHDLVEELSNRYLAIPGDEL
ncbi:aminotransferase class IV family protein [Nocardioides speluncae]|uniref:aminotransferase class IV family protein n=1 Tax=Nocardioides speluncae TaxID=2670337 RepID=UPI000D694019|nr:aminotransferase class IV family protein [Nocardioides speluncae]